MALYWDQYSGPDHHPETKHMAFFSNAGFLTGVSRGSQAHGQHIRGMSNRRPALVERTLLPVSSRLILRREYQCRI
eukprot:8500310-Pyramimonas_sp.AAC.1